MQLTAVIASIHVKREIHPDKFKIEFTTETVTKTGKQVGNMSPEQIKAISQQGMAKVLARCGNVPVTFKTRPASEVQPW